MKSKPRKAAVKSKTLTVKAEKVKAFPEETTLKGVKGLKVVLHRAMDDQRIVGLSVVFPAE